MFDIERALTWWAETMLDALFMLFCKNKNFYFIVIIQVESKYAQSGLNWSEL